jgi:hypothetical protein
MITLSAGMIHTEREASRPSRRHGEVVMEADQLIGLMTQLRRQKKMSRQSFGDTATTNWSSPEAFYLLSELGFVALQRDLSEPNGYESVVLSRRGEKFLAKLDARFGLGTPKEDGGTTIHSG